MLDKQQTIDLYERVLHISTQMLEAANQGDWDTVSQLQDYCSEQIEILKSNGPVPPLSGDDRDRKVEMIQQILANDKAIRDISTPWLKELSNLIHTTDNQIKMLGSYQQMNNL